MKFIITIILIKNEIHSKKLVKLSVILLLKKTTIMIVVVAGVSLQKKKSTLMKVIKILEHNSFK